MADEDRTPPHSVTLIEQLQETPYAFDFYQAVRRLDCAYPDKPQTGQSSRVVDDPVRFGQEASMAFAPATLQAFEPREEMPPRLIQRFLGLLGPQGALPLHLTEYIRDRLRNQDDFTILRFLDVFHHRLITLFYRAWARVRPTVSFDQPASDRFSDYVSTLFGLGMRSLIQRDALPDLPKRHFAGLMSCQTKHAEGLLAILRGYFGLPVQIDEFVGQWVELPVNCRCLLGLSSARLGVDTTVGSHIWDCQQKFRVILGPLTLDEYYRMLPGKSRLSDVEPIEEQAPLAEADDSFPGFIETSGAAEDELQFAEAAAMQTETPEADAVAGEQVALGGEGWLEEDRPTSVAAARGAGSNLTASKIVGQWPGTRPAGSATDHARANNALRSPAHGTNESGSPPGNGRAAANSPQFHDPNGDSAVPTDGSLGLSATAHRTPPRGVSLERLIAAVRSYVGDELQWDLQLILRKDDTPPLGLGIVGNLGWSSWVIRDHLPYDPNDLVLDAMQPADHTRRIDYRHVRAWDQATLGQRRDGQYIVATIDMASLDVVQVQSAT